MPHCAPRSTDCCRSPSRRHRIALERTTAPCRSRRDGNFGKSHRIGAACRSTRLVGMENTPTPREDGSRRLVRGSRRTHAADRVDRRQRGRRLPSAAVPGRQLALDPTVRAAGRARSSRTWRKAKRSPSATSAGPATRANHTWASAPGNCPPQYTRAIDTGKRHRLLLRLRRRDRGDDQRRARGHPHLVEHGRRHRSPSTRPPPRRSSAAGTRASTTTTRPGWRRCHPRRRCDLDP